MVNFFFFFIFLKFKKKKKKKKKFLYINNISITSTSSIIIVCFWYSIIYHVSTILLTEKIYIYYSIKNTFKFLNFNCSIL